jgi:transcriptional regulator with XRE-family HTH domain
MKTSATHVLAIESEDLLRELGHRISIARRARGITQADLAAQVGAGLSTVRHIEGGAPSVQIGYVVGCLWALELVEELRPSVLSLGRGSGIAERTELALPKRVRRTGGAR